MESQQLALTKFGNSQEAFTLQNFQMPKPVQKEAIVEVEASGLNFADVMARLGLYAPVKNLPFVLGYDLVGKVVELGKEADPNLLGKRVVSLARFGGYRKHINLNSEGLIPIPDDMATEEAINYTTAFLTAYLMAEEYTGIAEGKTALVYSAAGGVGYFLYHFLRAKGVKAQAVVGSAEKISTLVEMGLKDPIWLNSELENKSEKFDLIFNARGGQTVKKDLSRLSKGGKIILFGAADQLNQKGILGKLKLLFGFGFHSPIKLIVNSQSICGFNLLSLSGEHPVMVVKSHHRAIQKFKELNIPTIPASGFAPREVAKAHALLESGKSTGKIFIDWTKH
ncbi:alcohol dehydrogenase catalytic domain-containing protein [Luteibaculum oceani]|uniref:Enoyl reductase (ER) domain-containing protein n=1 Tax=Luteibaculum oceani TaxID=1294296 RepID=A0A5C6V2U4_9FLAO|nr:alcohol dehydrogenase catalytic domain-containing protein [Luteibaculum oceani]TXC79001.1 hypothetical protein FRX97_07235 [Luteibaculum oceani]